MKHLVYCITLDSEHLPHQLPKGIDGKPVHLLTEDGLAAIYSVVPDFYANVNAGRAASFAEVISTLYRTSTVLPMRYGCLLETRDHIANLLNGQRQKFLACLEELKDCTEMGVRIILDHDETETPDSSTSFSPGGKTPGTNYLEFRKRHYARLDTFDAVNSATAEKYRTGMEGLFVKCTTEYSAANHSVFQTPVLSLYFLVKREEVSRFRDVFDTLAKDDSAKVMLSGPWPPYNFVGV